MQREYFKDFKDLLQVRIKEEIPSIYRHYTRFEIARIIGARALQISMNAPILLKLSDDELRAVRYDPIKIAELEFMAGVLPITIRRPAPLKIEQIEEEGVELEEVVEAEVKEELEEEKKEAEKEVVEETIREMLEGVEEEETEEEKPVEEGELEE